MTLNELLDLKEAEVRFIDVASICNDSRAIEPGALFLAYPGSGSDGRNFIPQAIAAGAKAVVYDPKDFTISNESLKVPCIPFSDLSKNLSQIARKFYGDSASKLSITGVTGTNGKTTIAYQLAEAYNVLHQKSAYIGTLGEGAFDTLRPLSNTTPDALCLHRLFGQYVSEKMTNVCMEVSSHALSQGRVDGIEFEQAIFTNLTHDHLDYHGTMDSYAKAKAKLFKGDHLQVAILNGDDEYAPQMVSNLSSKTRLLTYGMNKACDVYATECKINKQGSKMTVSSPWGQYCIEVNSLGLFNLYNTLAIFTSLMCKGFSATQVIAVLKSLKPSSGRMEIISSTPTVIVDYAHTPDALKNALKTLRPLCDGRLIVVFGCGGDRDHAKRPLMGKEASKCADEIIVTSDNPRSEDPNQIIADVCKGIPSEGISLLTITDREQAIQQAVQSATPDDIILIAGKGHESYQEVGGKRRYFSDQVFVRSLFDNSVK